MTTVTTTPTATMQLDAGSLLRLMWLASPALPVGAFSYSEGLEAAVDAALVRDEATTAQWLSDHMALVMARGEWPAIAHAMTAWEHHDMPSVEAIDTWVTLTRESAEQRAQTQQMGTSLMRWLANGEHAADARLAHAQSEAWTWPVAYALAVALIGVRPREALLSAAFGWAENMAQAAMKAVPLGQASAQRVLARLTREMPDVVDHALGVMPNERRSFAPMLALLGARHETQYTRIFRS